MKRLYKGIVLLFIFVGAIAFMSKNIKEVQFEFDTTVAMGEATFPVVKLKAEDNYVNLLHGYSGNLDANIIRDNITLVNTDKALEILMIENKVEIRKLKYEIRSVSEYELLDSGNISALTALEDETYGACKSAKVRIKADLEQGKEYCVKLTLVTSESRKINFYTRIKYYQENTFLKEKMAFILDFHEKVLDKKKAEQLITYLEPDRSMANTSLALVNIHSSFDNFSWGNMKPTVISEIVPTIKEFNIETAAVELSYYVSADAGASQDEIYLVKEFFRVRYTKDRMYLLNYQRTMEAQFNIDLVSLTKNEIKIGITQETDLELVTSPESKQVAFVRQGVLWYYDLTENKIVKVFSYQKLKEDKEYQDYIWDYYDQHNIRILKMDENGDMSFVVYGYVNRGDYEGRIAMILYKFHANEKRIEELVYIPMETTYQILKEDLKGFSYVNEKGVFYFTLNNVIYSYNIIAKKLEAIASGITEENVMIPKDCEYIGWQNSNDPKESTSITLLNLETEEERSILAPEGDTIKILGSIDNNIIYGYVHPEDIHGMTDGSVIVPCYKLEISDQNGVVVKEYQVDGIYVTDIEINENIIELNRVMKKNNHGTIGFSETKSDNIINRINEVEQSINLSTRVTELAMTELYISMPDGFEMPSKPKLFGTVNTVITEDTALRLNTDKYEVEKYYVYALGGILMYFTNPAEAILEADENMGVVINQNNQVVWERGGKYNRKAIDDIEAIYTSNDVNSIGACLKMVIRYKKGSSSSVENVGGQSIFQGLKENLKYPPINLTGCTLDEVLYYVSSGRPVIAMKDKNNAVLIIGYDEYYITIIDPQAKTTSKITLSKAVELFGLAGNVFISYME